MLCVGLLTLAHQSRISAGAALVHLTLTSHPVSTQWQYVRTVLLSASTQS